MARTLRTRASSSVKRPMQIVKQSLAHRAFGDAHAIDAEVLDEFQQYRETRRKHRRALGVDVLEIEVIDVSGRDHALGQRRADYRA